MADEADRADGLIERALQEDLRKARQTYNRLPPSGHCYFCDEAIGPGLFCPPVDALGDGCSRDYEREQRMKAITRNA
jgi:hypothetical protein